MFQELNEMLIDLREDAIHLVPRLVLALMVLAVGYLVARLVKYLMVRLVKYLGKLIDQRFANINFDSSAHIFGIVSFWLIILATLLLISDILHIDAITASLGVILQYSPNIIAAVLTVSIASVFGRFIGSSVAAMSKKVGIDQGRTLGKIIQYLILMTALVIAVDQLGVEVTFIINMLNITLAALLFGAAFAFALGAKTSFSNILANFYARKRIQVGDEIVMGDVEGTILQIDSTVVVLKTEEGHCIIPAKDFSETKFLIKRT